MSTARCGPSVHATAVVLGTAGVLIRGVSGAGKTTSALALIDRYAAERRFAALVADDRVVLHAGFGRLIARSPAVLSGLVEARGLGIVGVAHEPAAVIRLVVDLVPHSAVTRMPDTCESVIKLLGVTVPRLAATAGPSLIPLVCLALHANSQPPGVSEKACLCVAT